jgi:hypothetical protein
VHGHIPGPMGSKLQQRWPLIKDGHDIHLEMYHEHHVYQACSSILFKQDCKGYSNCLMASATRKCSQTTAESCTLQHLQTLACTDCSCSSAAPCSLCIHATKEIQLPQAIQVWSPSSRLSNSTHDRLMPQPLYGCERAAIAQVRSTNSTLLGCRRRRFRPTLSSCAAAPSCSSGGAVI